MPSRFHSRNSTAVGVLFWMAKMVTAAASRATTR